MTRATIATATEPNRSVRAPDSLAQALAGVGAVIDTMGGGFTMRYTTVAVTAARPAPADPGAWLFRMSQAQAREVRAWNLPNFVQ